MYFLKACNGALHMTNMRCTSNPFPGLKNASQTTANKTNEYFLRIEVTTKDHEEIICTSNFLLLLLKTLRRSWLYPPVRDYKFGYRTVLCSSAHTLILNVTGYLHKESYIKFWFFIIPLHFYHSKQWSIKVLYVASTYLALRSVFVWDTDTAPGFDQRHNIYRFWRGTPFAGLCW